MGRLVEQERETAVGSRYINPARLSNARATGWVFINVLCMGNRERFASRFELRASLVFSKRKLREHFVSSDRVINPYVSSARNFSGKLIVVSPRFGFETA